MDDLKDVVSLRQLEPLARQHLPESAWDYVAGGAGDEVSLREASAAWQRIRLAPHALRDVSRIDTRLRLLGTGLPHPIVLAPTARHALYHPRGEAATIEGARAAEALYVQSSLGSTPLAQVGQCAGPTSWWFQLYIQRDRGFTAELVEQAVAAGASAIVLTVDTPTLGARDRDRRDDLGVSHGASYPILADAPLEVSDSARHRRVYNPLLAPDITWRDLEWLAQVSPVPVVTKGVLRPDDAVRCVGSGAAGIAVSNHGARNLDTVLSTADALPRIAEAVGGAVPLIVDGGIRRGTDVVKALALGATAVMVGRPYIWGLAAFGAAGVRHVVEILRTELEMAMALLGVTSLNEVSDDVLWEPGVRIGQ